MDVLFFAIQVDRYFGPEESLGYFHHGERLFSDRCGWTQPRKNPDRILGFRR